MGELLNSGINQQKFESPDRGAVGGASPVELGWLAFLPMEPEDPDQADAAPYNGQGPWRAPLGLVGVYLNSRQSILRIG